MAQTGFTPIQLYSSSTPTNAPSASNLTNDTKGSELAINIADKNLFFKDSTNAVNTVPIRQSSTSSDGWLSSTDWNTFNSKQPALVSGVNIKTVNGTTLLGSGDLGTITTAYGGTGLSSYTAGDLSYYASGTTFTKLAIGAANTVLTSSGTAPQWSTALSLAGNLTASNIGITNTNWLGWGNFASRFTGTGGGSINVVTNSVTAASWDASQNYSVVGNVVIATSGKGIDFSATPGTGTSELLNDYEEGTWTPNQGAGLTVVGTFSSNGTYTKVGRTVTIYGQISATTSITASGVVCSNLPYSPAGNVTGTYLTGGASAADVFWASGTSIYTVSPGISATSDVWFNFTYQV